MSDIEFPINIDREMDLSKKLARKSLEGISSLDYDAFAVSDEWRWGNDERYGFATGYVRAIEHRLIQPDRFIRLADARNSEEVFGMLADTDYGKGYQDEMAMISGPGGNGINIEQVLRQEADRVKKFINDLTQDREQTDILFSRDDFFNLRLSLKGIFGNVSVEDFFLPFGTLAPGLIYQEAKEGDKSEILPPHLKEAAVQAEKAYADTKSSMEIDRIIDTSMYRYMLARARDKEVFFLFKLITTEIDLVNIITFFRLKWVGEPLSTLQTALIAGGRIPFEVYYEFFPREIDDIETGFLSDEVYHDFIAEGVLHLKNDNSLIRMESLVDRELMKIINREKEINFGVEILIAYHYKKSIEMKKLRTVIIGKENGLSPEEIKARLGYVG
jgi:V/A-type H+/Na+-transporting ATPase subunit C